MSILKTESIASRPISDVYSPRVFSVLRGLKSTRTIACTPCTGSISPLRSILSSSSSKREREREREKESVSILAERAHNVQFVLDNTQRERERERGTHSACFHRRLSPSSRALFPSLSPIFARFRLPWLVVPKKRKKTRKEERLFESVVGVRSFLCFVSCVVSSTVVKRVSPKQTLNPKQSL